MNNPTSSTGSRFCQVSFVWKKWTLYLEVLTLLKKHPTQKHFEQPAMKG